MDLGNESNYQQHKGPIQVTPSSKRSKGAFKALWAVWEVALRSLKQYEEKKAKEKEGHEKGQKVPERIKLLRCMTSRLLGRQRMPTTGTQ